MRVAIDLVGQQADLLHHLCNALLNLLRTGFWIVGGQRLGDDLSDGHAWIERGQGVLVDHLHLTPYPLNRPGVAVKQVAIAHPQHLPALRLGQADDGARQGGFSTAGFTDDTEGFAGVQLEADAIDRLQLLRTRPGQAAFGVDIELYLEVLDAEQGVVVFVHRDTALCRWQAVDRWS